MADWGRYGWIVEPAPIQRTAPRAIISPMITDPITIEFEPLDPDTVYANYPETCRRAGIEPVPRERARSFIGELNEVLSGRPEPTTH